MVKPPRIGKNHNSPYQRSASSGIQATAPKTASNTTMNAMIRSGKNDANTYDFQRDSVKRSASPSPIFSLRAISTAAMRVIAPPKTAQTPTLQSITSKKYTFSVKPASASRKNFTGRNSLTSGSTKTGSWSVTNQSTTPAVPVRRHG